ncbi:SRPBCC family protein [Kribbella sindirgiensis]|uniref:SRPBCC family protein n=1 Tax=Kribbella sindirgiensis TaxID=1124744 RepID=A0A4R0I5S3_9ACTN|nr:SRPBCC family protein [Kribbella sindirgiensis]TCC15645.1 SRPBCC family protein [Kribbella sindirgiensis]
MNDYGVTGATTGVEVLIKLPIHKVWSGITAIDRYGEWSPECIYGAWLEKDVRFEARNRFPNGLETYVTCTVTVLEQPRRFGWDVYGDESVPFAHWEYELEDRGAETLVRQSFTHGPGNSGMRMHVVQHSHRAPQAIQGRLDQLSANMRTTLAAMESALDPDVA